ncbi:MAG: YbaB/EbfC family nucleoid-associated protein [Dehalococcoidia bacterium]
MNRAMRRQMKQLQGLQDMLSKAKEELAEMTVEASSGGGVVKVVMTGQQKVRSIKISPEVVDPDEVDLLEDMVLAAINEATEKSQSMASSHMGGLTGGLDIPGLT